MNGRDRFSRYEVRLLFSENVVIKAIGSLARKVQVSGLTTENPEFQAMGSWARQVQASLGKWGQKPNYVEAKSEP